MDAEPGQSIALRPLRLHVGGVDGIVNSTRTQVQGLDVFTAFRHRPDEKARHRRQINQPLQGRLRPDRERDDLHECASALTFNFPSIQGISTRTNTPGVDDRGGCDRDLCEAERCTQARDKSSRPKLPPGNDAQPGTALRPELGVVVPTSRLTRRLNSVITSRSCRRSPAELPGSCATSSAEASRSSRRVTLPTLAGARRRL